MAGRLLSAVGVAIAVACGGGSTGPTCDPDLAGEWSGSTSQGAEIRFTVSPDQKVTTITIGHDFDGCSGQQTFSNLALDIARDTGGSTWIGPSPFGPPPKCLQYRSFDLEVYRHGWPVIAIHGYFKNDGVTAWGRVLFYSGNENSPNYLGCDFTWGQEDWGASRH